MKKMTPNLYNSIKILLDCGNTVKETAEHLKLAPITVSRVKASENLDDYFHAIKVSKAIHAKTKPVEKPAEAPAQVVEHRQSVTVQATHYMESELKKQTEVLELISRKLTAQNELLEKLLDCWKDQ